MRIKNNSRKIRLNSNKNRTNKSIKRRNNSTTLRKCHLISCKKDLKKTRKLWQSSKLCNNKQEICKLSNKVSNELRGYIFGGT